MNYVVVGSGRHGQKLGKLLNCPVLGSKDNITPYRNKGNLFIIATPTNSHFNTVRSLSDERIVLEKPGCSRSELLRELVDLDVRVNYQFTTKTFLDNMRSTSPFSMECVWLKDKADYKTLLPHHLSLFFSLVLMNGDSIDCVTISRNGPVFKFTCGSNTLVSVIDSSDNYFEHSISVGDKSWRLNHVGDRELSVDSLLLESINTPKSYDNLNVAIRVLEIMEDV